MADQVSGAWAIVLGVGGLLTGGGGLWAFLSTREKIKASPPAAIAEADAKLIDSAAAFMAGMVAASKKQDDRLDDIERKLEGCEAHRDDCEKRVSELEAMVARLAPAEPPPPYLPGFEP